MAGGHGRMETMVEHGYLATYTNGQCLLYRAG